MASPLSPRGGAPGAGEAWLYEKKGYQGAVFKIRGSVANLQEKHGAPEYLGCAPPRPPRPRALIRPASPPPAARSRWATRPSWRCSITLATRARAPVSRATRVRLHARSRRAVAAAVTCTAAARSSAAPPTENILKEHDHKISSVRAYEKGKEPPPQSPRGGKPEEKH